MRHYRLIKIHIRKCEKVLGLQQNEKHQPIDVRPVETKVEYISLFNTSFGALFSSIQGTVSCVVQIQQRQNYSDMTYMQTTNSKVTMESILYCTSQEIIQKKS